MKKQENVKQALTWCTDDLLGESMAWYLTYKDAVHEILGDDDIRMVQMPSIVATKLVRYRNEKNSIVTHFRLKKLTGKVEPIDVSKTFYRWEFGDAVSIPHSKTKIEMIYSSGDRFLIAKQDVVLLEKYLASLSFPPPEYNSDVFKSVFLNKQTEVVKKDVLFFAQSYRWFRKHNIPYKRAYLLYGPPGNGKSTTVQIICDYFGVKPSTYDFTQQSVSPDASFIAWAGGGGEEENVPTLEWDEEEGEVRPRMRVLVLEDIDRFYPRDAANSGEKTSVSLTTLLNVLDGVYSSDNTVILCTANKPESLDQQVMLRRFDRKINYMPPTPTEAYRFLRKKFTDDSVSDDVINEVAESMKGYPFSALKNIHISAACRAFDAGRTNIIDEDVSEAVKDDTSDQNMNDAITADRGNKSSRIGFGD